jgi:hypothetical protein
LLAERESDEEEDQAADDKEETEEVELGDERGEGDRLMGVELERKDEDGQSNAAGREVDPATRRGSDRNQG